MIEAEPVCVAVIPARGGSKGIPRKNIVDLGSKPLLAWSIEAALRADRFGSVLVSTDDEEIAEVARAWGAEVPFLRPAELAGDHISPHEGVSHLLHVLTSEGRMPRPEFLATLSPTFPFRKPGTIARCVDALRQSEVWAVITYNRSDSWTGRYYFEEDREVVPVRIRWRGRQQYFQNGCVSVSRHPMIQNPLGEPVGSWEKRVSDFADDLTRRGLVPGEKSCAKYVEVDWKEAIDIDTPEDLDRARILLEKLPAHGAPAD